MRRSQNEKRSTATRSHSAGGLMPRFEELECRIVLTAQGLSADELATLLSYKHGVWEKFDPALADLYQHYQSSLSQNIGPTITMNGLQVFTNTKVVVEIVATENTVQVVSSLKKLGMTNVVSFDNVIDGILPIASLPQLNSLSDAGLVRGVMAPATHAGQGNNQGVQAMNVDLARAQFGVTGVGSMIGVISDSFNARDGYADDIASGDLPPGIVVLQDAPFGTDEGRAMLQLVYDVAPGADLAFHTGDFGQANFAQGILDLKAAGANVITDDLLYFAEPMFQDGIIAKAVTQVVSQGAVYFSSAANNGENGYQDPYKNSGTELTIDSQDLGTLHDFDPGAGVDTLQQVTLGDVARYSFVLQWDQPFLSASNGQNACQSDYDFFILNAAGDKILASGTTNNIGRDALEVVQFANATAGTVVNIAITKVAGADAGQMRWVALTNGRDLSIDEFDTQGPTTYGHSSAVGAIGVGAANYLETPRFGQSPPLLEDFSSNGPVQIYFDGNGNRLPQPIDRGQPSLVAPDGVQTTVPGFDPFFGTSAAAPNAAAVAALMLQVNSALSPDELYSAMQSTAVNMVPPATTDGAGFGLVNAQAAVAAVFSPEITLTPDLKANAVGATHIVTATVVNSLNGQAVQGVTVNFVITGANVLVGTATTDADGNATFSYVGQNAGLDQIVADINSVNSNAVFKLWTLASSLRGTVYVDSNNNGQIDPGELPIPLVTIHLTGIDAIGDPVDQTAVTDNNGQYQFSLLTNGEYTLTEVQPPAYINGQSTPGTAGGFAATNAITDIVLDAGVDGTGYLFGELGIRPDFISKRLFLNSTTNQVIPGNVTRPQDATSRAEVSDAVQEDSPSASGSFLVSTSSSNTSAIVASPSSSSESTTSVASVGASSSSNSSPTVDSSRSRSSRTKAVDEVLSDDEFLS